MSFDRIRLVLMFQFFVCNLRKIKVDLNPRTERSLRETEGALKLSIISVSRNQRIRSSNKKSEAETPHCEKDNKNI